MGRTNSQPYYPPRVQAELFRLRDAGVNREKISEIISEKFGLHYSTDSINKAITRYMARHMARQKQPYREEVIKFIRPLWGPGKLTAQQIADMLREKFPGWNYTAVSVRDCGRNHDLQRDNPRPTEYKRPNRPVEVVTPEGRKLSQSFPDRAARDERAALERLAWRPPVDNGRKHVDPGAYPVPPGGWRLGMSMERQP